MSGEAGYVKGPVASDGASTGGALALKMVTPDRETIPLARPSLGSMENPDGPTDLEMSTVHASPQTPEPAEQNGELADGCERPHLLPHRHGMPYGRRPHWRYCRSRSRDVALSDVHGEGEQHVHTLADLAKPGAMTADTMKCMPYGSGLTKLARRSHAMASCTEPGSDRYDGSAGTRSEKHVPVQPTTDSSGTDGGVHAEVVDDFGAAADHGGPVVIMAAEPAERTNGTMHDEKSLEELSAEHSAVVQQESIEGATDGNDEQDSESPSTSPMSSSPTLPVVLKKRTLNLANAIPYTELPACSGQDADAERPCGELLWAPPPAIDMTDTEALLREFCYAHEDGRGVPVEMCLRILHETGYRTDEARRILQREPLVTVDRRLHRGWTAEEEALFEQGLLQCGKRFHLLQQRWLPHKTIADVIEFYYLWKKTERHDQFLCSYWRPRRSNEASSTRLSAAPGRRAGPAPALPSTGPGARTGTKPSAAAAAAPHRPRRPGRPPAEPEVKRQRSDPSREQLYEVECILDRRYVSSPRRVEYLVKWLGYPDEANTWEPEENLQGNMALVEFLNARDAARRR